MGFLKHLQSKPSNVKAQYSFAFASLITLVIGIIWVTTVPARFASVDTEAVLEEDETSRFGSFLKDSAAQLGNVVGWKKEQVPESAQLEEIMGEVVANQQAVEEQVAVPEEVTDSALSSLNIDESASSTQSGTTTLKALRAFGAPKDAVSTTSAADTLATTSEPQIPRQPRVILIATTTSQKTE